MASMLDFGGSCANVASVFGACGGALFLSLDTLDHWYACIKSASPCSHVWFFGFSTCGNMFVRWKIIGKGTICSAMLIICIHRVMSTNFDNPNWVYGFFPLFDLFLFLLEVCVHGCCVCIFLGPPQWLCLNRATRMAPSYLVASSFPSWGSRHMHPTSSCCQNVLHVDIGRRLH